MSARAAQVPDRLPLKFGGSIRRVAPRHGISDCGPADAGNTAARTARTFRLGIVGTPGPSSRRCFAPDTSAVSGTGSPVNPVAVL
ncbi:hypothetical protein [Streptomyces flaveus]|uniref:hypothetical protein n=1 Tax=Streptomyces flaveus TaxID=66370 RepID=UPI0033176DF2